MAFAVDSTFELPQIQHGVGRVLSKKRPAATCLEDSDPFLRPAPFHRRWSERTSTCVALPIHNAKERILHAIENHSVIVVQSPPATGKTTQIPQMILDDAVGKHIVSRIVVTNPKRLGTISCARHVVKERGETALKTPKSVGYSTRRDKELPQSLDSIFYVTEGTLVNIIDNAAFSHIVIDEFQERTLDVDLLLMKIKKKLSEQPSLKLIVMTATVDVQILKDYFGHFRLIVLQLGSSAYPINDYYIDDIEMLKNASWRCPSEVVYTVVQAFRQIAKFNKVLIFLADKVEITNCLKELTSKLAAHIKVLPLHSGGCFSKQLHITCLIIPKCV